MLSGLMLAEKCNPKFKMILIYSVFDMGLFFVTNCGFSILKTILYQYHEHERKLTCSLFEPLQC